MSGLALLSQFIFRLSFGLALAMAVTPHRLVTSGYYRNHLYVLLGLDVLAALAALADPAHFAVWPPVTAAALSYLGSVCWLYEKPAPGKAMLALIAIVTLAGAYLAAPLSDSAGVAAMALHVLDPITSGLVLGVTVAAMFLGHWYLNTPTMVLRPLERLVLMMGAAIVLRMLVCGIGFLLTLSVGTPGTAELIFIALRWLAGLVGALGLAAMTWQTLKIPNTQSATGILYVAVIATFLGELTALLLSRNSPFPL